MTTAAVTPVIDVTDRDFEAQVIERSRTTPVVVDFWAPWCGPCRVLGPVLERLASEAQGAFVLAKVNVDENPRVAGSFRVQGIPMVIGFRDGKPADTFTGALPETQVRAWLRKLVPAGADQIASEAAALEASNPTKAIERYRAALAEDPKHEASLIGLGRLLVLTGDPEAPEVLRRVPVASKRHSDAQALLGLSEFLATPTPRGRNADPANDPRYAAAADALVSGDLDTAITEYQKLVDANPADTEAALGLARARLMKRTSGVDLNAARQAAADAPDDVDAQVMVADLDLLGGHVEDAFLRLIELVRRTSGDDRDRARVHLIEMFAVVGNDDPRVLKGRQSLANALF